MGAAIGGLLGLNGGAGGTGFQGPQGSSIVNPTDPAQIKAAYDQSQQAMQGQNSLLGALQAQNGLQNQSSVYNQLQNVANGQGPNPAQAMLNNATGQNVANQAALMAGQRGAGANVGLMARQAAQTGAGIQQNAAGQGALMQANQSMNALNQLGGIANTQASNQIGQTNANTQAQQAMHNALLGAQQGVNQANVSSQGNVNSANAGMADTRMKGQGDFIGGLMGGASKAIFGAEGGMVPDQSGFQGQSKFGQFLHEASNPGSIQNDNLPTPGGESSSKLAQGASAMGEGIVNKLNAPSAGTMSAGPDVSSMGMMAAKGGQVPALVSPGEKYLKPKDVEEVKKGKNPMEVGEKIPGEAKVKGAKNDYANDTVPKQLEEGGIILPRSVTQSKHPHWAAHKFVAAIMKENALKGKK